MPSGELVIFGELMTVEELVTVVERVSVVELVTIEEPVTLGELLITRDWLMDQISTHSRLASFNHGETFRCSLMLRLA